MLVNAVLYNCSVWYNLSKKDLKELDDLDKLFFSRLFQVPRQSPFESFFLETGVMNFETIVKSRRIVYYHNLLKRNKSQMIYSFLMTQISKPSKKDWIHQVNEDLEDFEIDPSIPYLQSLSFNSLKTIVKNKSKIFALKVFIDQKSQHSKMKNLKYSDLKMQEYLLSPTLSLETKKIILRWRISMELFGENFKAGRKEVLCPFCKLHKDSQSESFRCKVLKGEINIVGKYEHVFENITMCPEVINTIVKISKVRKLLFNQE